LGASAEAAADEGVLALFQAALEDDLGTPKALALVWDLVQREDISSAVKRATLLRMDEVFGLGMQVWSMEVNEIPEDILAIKQDREEARRAKNWQASDTLRDALLARGWIVEDGVGGSSLRKA
jgi:cysteinyl-tRNA synthetase